MALIAANAQNSHSSGNDTTYCADFIEDSIDDFSVAATLKQSNVMIKVREWQLNIHYMLVIHHCNKTQWHAKIWVKFLLLLRIGWFFLKKTMSTGSANNYRYNRNSNDIQQKQGKWYMYKDWCC